MAINLSKLNISLDTFNAESSGTYNIGQMKLSSDGKSVSTGPRSVQRRLWLSSSLSAGRFRKRA